jgi:DMSO reductase anchor subunit
MRASFLLLAFVLPALLLVLDLSYHSTLSLGLAFITQFAGLVAERWYFFAEARHPQNLYYQGVS